MNYLSKLSDRYGLLRNDLDCHVVRASMVQIFLMFGYQKWFEYQAKDVIPFISNGPRMFWTYPVFGIRGRELIPRRLGMASRRAPIHRILEQDGRGSWRARRNRFVRGYHNDYSIHAGRMGRIS